MSAVAQHAAADTTSVPDTVLFSDTLHALAPSEAHPSFSSLNITEKVKRTGSLIYKIVKSFDDIDTRYIEPQRYNYAAMLQNTNFFQVFRLRGKSAEGNVQSITLSPAPAFKVGPYFGWRWIFLGYTFDVSRPQQVQKTQEFSLSLYSSMIGCDLVYVKNDGHHRLQRATGFEGIGDYDFKDEPFNGLKANTLSFNAYFVTNHRRFSYPAAYSQSTVQRKSAGSWLFGLRYDHHDLSFDYTALPAPIVGTESAPVLINELRLDRIDYYSYQATAGYAYNWVFARNWLISGSLAPALGIRRAKGAKIRGDELWVSMKNFNFDFVARGAIVWNNTRLFAGASFVSHFFDYKKERFSMINSITYINIYAGFNFNRKRQYRK